MKRFRFQLEPVLGYKQQALDSLMTELGAARERVRLQTEERDGAQRRAEDYDAECARRREEGMTVLEALECESCMRVLEHELQEEEAKLQELKKQEEAKRLQVIEARKEVFSLEKLKGIRRGEYDAALAKAEERILDDLTASKRIMALAGAGNSI